ncbi:uncharacterized protein CIMG_05517 [Coccidioides immitis RS]|uniref:ELYS-like domain-containing protein n=7 Tax=Coccidioides TaxID=5500 RepID=A0A0E1RYV6_COCIM|nr:uncharacterized protein CIMG_05517 [Coccidioides immitis RS]XP_003067699.1 hypothetical protein CPC735_066540 [Coccidioides posadasii C735 delta SOWgp]EFW17406.1 conserved hypothetical protein [Coccidioides posadasii str. Silveira]KMM70944.1 hypothetical protein CPAG_07253 [Coccidioides posadasii RMSCC 3488]KMP05648.1 hypothetical protein CIRG_05329 [Coccidioides immitis RMSCC 2394]KMU74379.1 hypothetical protein CISG_04452 [Coccidioides immitis RMSCC 3703]KMU86878.1 hypothetical protein C|eukprot:XP_003067699.1 hypothetical protein CPC735_066540 [Coccidioides posadasii C735 delta SOWgp]
MARWDDFNVTFGFKGDYPYNPKVVDRIIANRKALYSTLFIDRLLGALGIDSAPRLYPPKSIETLRKLHREILASGSPNHHKQSVIYYLLRDCENLDDGTNRLEFARRCLLPQKYKLLVDGIWYMDRLEFQSALGYLTEPSLIPTFPDEILYVLSTLSEQDDHLATAYYVAVSPPLATSEVLNAYFAVLCRSGVSTAFCFTRKQPLDIRRELFGQLVVFVLAAKAGEERAEKAMELVNLPFSDIEIEWFEDCLLHGKAKNLPGAKDTVMMRRVATGHLDNLGALESLGGRKIEGLNWDILRKNLKPSVS